MPARRIPRKFSDLNDTHDLENATDGQVPVFDEDDGLWHPGAGGGAGSLPVPFTAGNGSPVGVLEAGTVGELYLDATLGRPVLYIATAAGDNNAWALVGGARDTASSGMTMELTDWLTRWGIDDVSTTSVFSVDDAATTGDVTTLNLDAPAIRAANLPTSDPGAVGRWWADPLAGFALKVSQGGGGEQPDLWPPDEWTVGEDGSLQIDFPAIAAHLTLPVAEGGDDAIEFTAVAPGSDGNSITVAKVDPEAPDSPLSVSVVGNDITISLGTDSGGGFVSTGTEIIEALADSPEASDLVSWVDSSIVFGEVATDHEARNLIDGEDGFTGVLISRDTLLFGAKNKPVISNATPADIIAALVTLGLVVDGT